MLDSIPSALHQLKAWLLWRQGVRRPDGKFQKVPHYVNDEKRRGEQGSSLDRANLATFQEAAQARGPTDGVGLALLAELGLVILDCDNVINPETGEIADWARDVCSGTYTEVSPSGRGLRAVFYGELSDAKNHERGFEVFCRKGFVTFTGNRLEGSESEIALLGSERSARIDELLGRKTKKRGRPTRSVTVSAERVRTALKFLDPDERDLWLKVGWALG